MLTMCWSTQKKRHGLENTTAVTFDTLWINQAITHMKMVTDAVSISSTLFTREITTNHTRSPLPTETSGLPQLEDILDIQ